MTAGAVSFCSPTKSSAIPGIRRFAFRNYKIIRVALNPITQISSLLMPDGAFGILTGVNGRYFNVTEQLA
jgi:hypothetical protein